MANIIVKDKEFKKFIKEEDILAEINRVAAEINRDYEGKTPLFICILNGSFMFASDLLKSIKVPCNISFVKFSSYSGTTTTGKIKEMIGLKEDIEGRDVIIVEDIVDTGYTMRDLLKTLSIKKLASLNICTMLVKPDKLEVELDIKYKAMEIPNDFIVGYGLDYDGFGRNYRDIYKIV